MSHRRILSAFRTAFCTTIHIFIVWRLVYTAIHALPLLLLNIIGLGCCIYALSCAFVVVYPLCFIASFLIGYFRLGYYTLLYYTPPSFHEKCLIRGFLSIFTPF
ncbi:hypothetical protein [Enterococcus phage vB_EfKS5]|nr:hypothetical protein [Enterococcus phage vB_EfKS5]